MNTIIQDCEQFLGCHFDEYEEVIIGENLEIPFLNKGGTANTAFETNKEFSGNYRKIYLHPSLYYKEMFSEEYRGQIDNLKLHVKRGHKVRFLYSEHNLALLCCIMAEIFQDCKGIHRDYVDYTNVPFPYKRSDSGNTWIWACNWGKDFPDRIETKEDVRKFRNYVRLRFPPYNAENCPVKHLETEKEEVTRFSVHLCEGLLTVIPGSPQENILVTIENFPSGTLNESLKRKKEMTVNLSMSQGRRSWKGTLSITQLLRFLLIYRASKQYQGLVYDWEKNGTANMFYQTETELKEMPYNGLFLTGAGEYDTNFTATLDKLIKPLTGEVSKKYILRLTEKGSRCYSPQKATLLLCECYQHLTVSFSPSALENFKHLRLGDVTAHPHIKSLSERLEQYKKDILEATER